MKLRENITAIHQISTDIYTKCCKMNEIEMKFKKENGNKEGIAENRCVPDARLILFCFQSRTVRLLL